MEDLQKQIDLGKSRFSEDWMQLLRNQLNIISTSVFLLENEIQGSNLWDKQRYLEKIKEAMDRINIIIR